MVSVLFIFLWVCTGSGTEERVRGMHWNGLRRERGGYALQQGLEQTTWKVLMCIMCKLWSIIVCLYLFRCPYMFLFVVYECCLCLLFMFVVCVVVYVCDLCLCLLLGFVVCCLLFCVCLCLLFMF